MKTDFFAGYAKINITPSLGVSMIGYYIDRFAEGVLDELEAIATAFKKGENTVLLIAVDNCELTREKLDPIRQTIQKETGVSADKILIHSTHTHTGPGPSLTFGENKALKEYYAVLSDKLVQVAKSALSDLKPARMGYGVGKAPNVAFVRRFRMKDGSVMTNPGVNNPDIVSPIGEVDERVNVIRVDREGGESIVIVNFGNHPDTVGGSKISGDWPSFSRKFVENSIENTKCIFLNGAQGDVNHVNVHPKGGDFNDLFMDFDGCSRGYGHARHIGRVVAGAVMQVYDKVNYIEVDSVDGKIVDMKIPSNKASSEELILAKKYHALHLAGKDEEIPYNGMMLTTVVAEAKRMVNLENGPDYFNLFMTILKLGDINIIGFPGEPFTGIGRAVKELKEEGLIFPVCCANDNAAYFPTNEAYDEGGYEARSSTLKKGVAELLVNYAKENI
ncbi:MAG: hypothetical protein IJF76_05615 [Clostridia bacterium]|nr:hypothetical protein [Clostridia bacterium]